MHPPHPHCVLSLHSNNSSMHTHVPLTSHSLPVPVANLSLNNSSSSRYGNYSFKQASQRRVSPAIPFVKGLQSLQQKMASPGTTLSSLDDGKVMLWTSTSMALLNLTTFGNYSILMPNYSISHPPLTLNSLAPPNFANLSISSLRKTRHMACRDLQRDSCDVCDLGNEIMYIHKTNLLALNWLLQLRRVNYASRCFKCQI